MNSGIERYYKEHWLQYTTDNPYGEVRNTQISLQVDLQEHPCLPRGVWSERQTQREENDVMRYCRADGHLFDFTVYHDSITTAQTNGFGA